MEEPGQDGLRLIVAEDDEDRERDGEGGDTFKEEQVIRTIDSEEYSPEGPVSWQNDQGQELPTDESI